MPLRQIRSVPRKFTSASTTATTHTASQRIARPSNDLPFSGERRGRVRAYHGREESRASARDVAAHATSTGPVWRSAAATAGWTGRRTQLVLLQSPLTLAPGPAPIPSPPAWSFEELAPNTKDEPAAPRPVARARHRRPTMATDVAADPRRPNRAATSRRLPCAPNFRRSLSNDLAFSGERPPERSEEGRSSAATPCYPARPSITSPLVRWRRPSASRPSTSSRNLDW
jgi:hypothetical protein